MTRASLFLCHRLPFPPNKGDKIRSYALLKHLAAKGPVNLACFIDDAADLEYREEVRAMAGGECLFEPIGQATRWWRSAVAVLTGQPITTAYFSSQHMSRWVRSVIATKDVANTVVFGSAMAPYLLGIAARHEQVLFDMVDVDSDKWRQYAQSSRGLFSWIYRREARTVEELEKKAAFSFGKTLLVSPYEAETFRKLAPESADKIAALNNGVDLERFSPGTFGNPFPANQVAIVMTGRMDYRPNHEGAVWFAQNVAPRITAKHPSAHVYFVGSNPPAALRRIETKNITVTGAVDDVRPYLQWASAVIAPLLIARGVQNKVLEAMAMKKVVVATHEATRALKVKSGQHLWIENDPQRFADAVMASFSDPVRWQIMDNARRYVEQNHNWQTILCEFDALLNGLARQSGASDPCMALTTTRLPSSADFTGAKA